MTKKTKKEYKDEIKARVLAEMAKIPRGLHGLDFWFELNKQEQKKLDEEMKAKGDTVEK